ncbi:hypothetical protein JCM5353_005777 [Sporobolomyces roseus]
MSLSSLPTELVRQIIKSSAPSTFHSNTYDERQFTLRSLCLVSRLFRQLAQPLLFEIIWSYSPESLDAALKALGSEQGGKAARHFLLTCDENCPYLPDRFDKLVQHLSGICQLVLKVAGEDKLELASLQSLPYLASLQLSGGGYELSSPLVLGKLHTLTLDDEVLEIFANSLDSEHLPSLRNLALLRVYNEEDANRLRSTLFANLITQLVSFHSDWELARTAPELLRSYVDHILFYSYCSDLSRFTLMQLSTQHLQLCELLDDRGDTIPELEKFASWIQSGKALALRSLYLEADLQHPKMWSDGINKVVRKLQKVCKDKRIEIVFEKQAKDANVDSSISAEFCRRQEASRKIR